MATSSVITLFISSDSCKNLSRDHIGMLIAPVVCQVSKTFNNVKNNEMVVSPNGIQRHYNYMIKYEHGFKIKVFINELLIKQTGDDIGTLDGLKFKELVWNPLCQALDLQCAFVIQSDKYMGCILNWPDIFRPSACPGL